jgi:hypothetical protein
MPSSSKVCDHEDVMEFDEWQGSMEFVVTQQAQFVADLQQSRELSDRRHEKFRRHSSA